MDCEDPDGEDNPDEEYDYPYEEDDSQEQDQEPQEDDDDCHWGGDELHSQGQPEEGASMVKTILSQMRRLAEETDKENKENLR